MRKKLPFYNYANTAAAKWLCVFGSTLFLSLSFTSYGQVQLLKDANTAELPYVDEYSWLTNGGSYIYYVSNNELWKSNGTSAGTVRQIICLWNLLVIR